MVQMGQVLIYMTTPFKENGELDCVRAKRLAEQIANCDFTDSIVVAASSGEFASLTFKEKIEFFGCVKEAIGDKPLIAGTGAVTTKEAIALTKEAEKAGVDVALLVPPYYYKPSQEEIYEHMANIAKATSLPIMLYNVGAAGVNIEPDTIARLSQIDNIIALKEIGLNTLQVAPILMKAQKGFLVYAGSLGLTPCILAQGGVGVVSEVYFGDKAKKMINYYLSGNFKKGLEVYFDILKCFSIFSLGRTSIVPIIKYAMNLAGFDAGPVRPPLIEVDEDSKRIIQTTLKEAGIIK
ncbi:4-hydroxy-tetrahydrodipicolinate synthase [Candidatus Aerophobetes bacterium]|nr:4-hydroxy-tetrahydrodipicolinate synthase [Candidatus Aerophobetes bacterium]